MTGHRRGHRAHVVSTWAGAKLRFMPDESEVVGSGGGGRKKHVLTGNIDTAIGLSGVLPPLPKVWWQHRDLDDIEVLLVRFEYPDAFNTRDEKETIAAGAVRLSNVDECRQASA